MADVILLNEESEEPQKDPVKEILDRAPLPQELDPFTRTLLGGVDEVARHQAMTLVVPILSYIGKNIRVLYNSGTLRWICGQSWQIGDSGTGKSEMVRALETLFLPKELSENRENAQKVSEYSLLSEKEKKETRAPEYKVTIFDSVPTAIALLEQMQKNCGDVIYLSCTEGGEFGKKVGGNGYGVVPDMMKKSYDGTGEPFIHMTKESTYFTHSMKLCSNIGGTPDQMYRILRICNADGTLSRGNLTILPARKDEKVDGPYKSASWDMPERVFLRECTDRLRTLNNKFHENEKPDEIDECNALLEKYGLRKEGAPIPTVQDLEDCVQFERCAKAFRIPEVLELGRSVKARLTSIGDVASRCCSRADERAMGLCYMLLIANGFAPLRSGGGDEVHRGEARTAEDCQLLTQCIGVARWWIMLCIDFALAMQSVLDLNCLSMKEGLLAALKSTPGEESDKPVDVHSAAFDDFEARHAGELVSVEDLRECPVFTHAGRSTLYRQAEKRGWKSYKRGLRYLMPEKKEEAAP